jgi:hypothetical protein
MRPTRRLPVAVLALSLSLSACGSGADDKTKDALVAGLQKSVETGTPLNLGEVVDGDWGRVLFVCPYEEKRSVEDRLGFAWPDFSGRDDSEGLATFVFASAEAVTTWATVGRNFGDPCSGPLSSDAVPRAEARFAVQQTDETGDGRPFYSLVPQRR